MSVNRVTWRFCAPIVPLVGLLTAAIPAAAQQRDGHCNAAVEYWQGFALLPAMNEQQRSIAQSCTTAPLDAEAQRLIDGSGPSLKQLHRGFACDACDWGLHTEDGIALLMPHLPRARELVRLACLRARDRIAHKQGEAAVQDIDDGLVLARRVGQDNFLIAILVQDSMQNLETDAIGPQLNELDATALAALADGLGKLPPGGSLNKSVEVELKFGLGSITRELRSMPAGPDWQQQVANSLGLPGESAEAGRAAIDQLHAQESPQKLAARLEELRPLYGQFSAALKLPPDQAHARLEAIRKQAADVPLASVVLPDYARAYDKHMAAEVRLVMLRAAVAVLQHGPDQLRGIPDPASGKPFTYRSLAHGFELASTFRMESMPLVLTVGHE